MALDALERASHEKRIAALASVGSAVLLISLKIFLVIRTGSLGVLSEALHSILDFVAAVITYLRARGRSARRRGSSLRPWKSGKFLRIR